MTNLSLIAWSLLALIRVGLESPLIPDQPTLILRVSRFMKSDRLKTFIAIVHFELNEKEKGSQ